MAGEEQVNWKSWKIRSTLCVFLESRESFIFRLLSSERFEQQGILVIKRNTTIDYMSFLMLVF